MASTQPPIVPIREALIGNIAAPSVLARDLHRVIGSKRQFSNWIQNRIDKYGFVAGVDFVAYRDNSGPQHIVTKEYLITLTMAKELAMVEQTEQGKLARRYFIEVEKRYLSEKLTATACLPSIPAEGPGYPRVTSIDLDRLNGQIDQIKAGLPVDRRPAVARRIWCDLWQIAGGRREHRRLLPSERMPLFLTYLADATGSRRQLGAAEQPKQKAAQAIDVAKTAIDLPLPAAAEKLGVKLDALNQVLCEAHVCVRAGVLSQSYANGTLFRRDQEGDGTIIVTRRGQLWLTQLLNERQRAKPPAQMNLLPS